MVSVLRRKPREAVVEESAQGALPSTSPVDHVEIPVDDPLHSYLVSVASPVTVAELEFESEILDSLRGEGIEMVIPLVGQGELLGALYLGPRLSDQPYSTDDRRLLSSLASQVAPAMQVAQLVREQQAEAKERERIQQELQVAALIQHTLLPKELPSRPGWSVDAFYRPARSVGGDFYDFIDLADGRLGVTIGDVTDKGVPAALVMATCRSMLRAAAFRSDTPGAVLADVNDTLVDEIPPAMFVTCLYAIIDTRSGRMTVANAGHNLPYIRTDEGVVELRATGMPLGLMPGMVYEERSFEFSDGNVMVLTSDGITEAHDRSGEMYGFSRLLGRVAAPVADGDVCGAVVQDVESHTGPDAEQEDDITLVVVKRTMSAADAARVFDATLDQIASFSLSSKEGNERLAIARVVEAVGGLDLDDAVLERLKTAVGETVMNAMEHGNQYQEDLDVQVSVAASAGAVRIRVADHGGDPDVEHIVAPDLEAKLAGEQTPRGWGLFLIGQMVDEVSSSREDGLHVVELVMNRERGS